MGGVLLQTALKGVDGKIYTLAQGALTVGGFSASGKAASTTKNIATVGIIPGGGIVERGIPFEFNQQDKLTLNLRVGDFSTAQQIAERLNGAMLSGLMNVGKTALNAAQAWISVTGSNIANADTEGYTRRYVDQRDAGTLVAKPGGEGLGVNAQQVLRYFNSFLESSYVRQSTNSARWEEQENIMVAAELWHETKK